jgi:streptomycin 6-kinase
MALADLGVGPTVHEVIETPTGTWTVAQRIFPGTPVGDMNPTDIDLETIGSSLGPLVGQPAPSPNMPTLTDWLRTRLTDDGLTDLAPGRQLASLAERQQALAILDNLETSRVDGLCHGDASPRNLLVNDDRRLMLIDPRGLAGEPAFDLAVIALKAADAVPLAVSTTHLARKVGVDPERVRAWIQVADVARV